ncbi:penicillin-binding protein 2 [Blastococcus brunescens]|uniref:Penicillin-binding protein 2 n=1 Tax=Blastococcus brunescens TaxID=1564165 RepID=A0ABZ1B449_9ACTN|nr:penicillin-binding protein 2 [Blastococcus sp. BMG 8361]WRL63835.1 penicillin-binding protein 2 [Blastococcus sp. BMG 8361]
MPTDGRLKYLRQYPQGPLYAAVTGYHSLIYNNSQLEYAENDVLSGSDGRLALRRLADMFTGRDPAGGDVVLTLDPAVQEAAMAGLEGVTGAVVALDPSTGAVLGMASTPSYDPTLLSSHDPAAIRAYWEELEAAEIDPRRNRAIGDNYPPGSLFKVIVAAAALEDGLTPDSVVPAPRELPSRTAAGSSPTSAARRAAPAGNSPHRRPHHLLQHRLRPAGDRHGRGARPRDGRGVRHGRRGFRDPLDVAPSGVGDIVDDAALAQTSIGQRDVRMTPLQAAMIAATVANDGVQMKPYLVDQVQAPDLTVIDSTESEVWREPISAEVANQLTEMMVSVVADGSGRAARIPGIEVAGKTGTAQVSEDVADHTWFMGFAPADDPQIAVAVFVANGGGTGGERSAPIARQVIEAYLDGQGG